MADDIIISAAGLAHSPFPPEITIRLLRLSHLLLQPLVPLVPLGLQSRFPLHCVGLRRASFSTPSSRVASFAHLLVLGLSYHLVRSSWRYYRSRGLYGIYEDLVRGAKSIVGQIVLALPSTQAQVHAELLKAKTDLEAKLAPPLLKGSGYLSSLPPKGWDADQVSSELDSLKGLEKDDVQSGRVSGAVYHGGKDLEKVINNAMEKFVVANPLHPDVFPGVRKMEAEIVAFTLNLFNNPVKPAANAQENGHAGNHTEASAGTKTSKSRSWESWLAPRSYKARQTLSDASNGGAGTTTSGGTESILMACKTYRDWAMAEKGITNPEMIIPTSAHAAFFKASDYFGIKLRLIPVDAKTRKADIAAMSRAINSDTIMLVGSAPNFPDGAIDDIVALGKLATKHNIGFHVDCCLGSFLMPFLRRMTIKDASGKEVPAVPPFDFSVRGVTSISCDTHKYGFCPKGSSVIMYKNPALRRYQYYIQPDWSGGVYASPSIAGSRPGAILAGAWAVMTHLGEDGYAQSCATICGAARDLKVRLRSEFADELYVLGDPLVSVVAFGSDKLNIYAIGDKMSKRGWHLNALAGPPALHMAVTLPVSRAIDELLSDLREVVDEVKAAGNTGNAGDMVALYGLGQTPVGPQLVTELASIFIDTLYLSR